jgi:hypothetical protein
MNAPDHDKLLNELLAEGELKELRQSSLENGLTALRAARESSRTRRLVVATLIPALVLVVILGSQIIPAFRSGKTNAARSAQRAENQSPVKVITDEELFALFPNRPMALVGEPGHQEVVFLDQRGSDGHPNALAAE